MSLAEQIDLSLCSKEQKEGFISPTDLPFLFTVNQRYASHYFGINNIVRFSRHNSSFDDSDSNSMYIGRGLLDFIRIVTQSSEISDVSKENDQIFIIKENRIKTIISEIENTSKNKNIFINKLETDIDYIIYFGKKCTVSRVAFREFCNTNGINFKITRDVKKANLLIGNLVEQHNMLSSVFSEKIRFFNINGYALSYTLDVNDLELSDSDTISGYYKVDDVLKANFSINTGIPLHKTDILNGLNASDIHKTFKYMRKYLKDVEPLIYSNIVTDNNGKYTSHGTYIKEIIKHSYYRIQKQTNYKILPEVDLQKQMLDVANVVLNADKTLQCIDLIKNPTSHLLGCKLLCNVNLRQSGIYGVILYNMFEISITTHQTYARELRRYKNRVEFKSFNTQYKIFTEELKKNFLNKIDKGQYCIDIVPYYGNTIPPSILKAYIDAALNSMQYTENLLLKTKVLSDVFNIPNLEDMVLDKFQKKTEELEQGIIIFKNTLTLHSRYNHNYTGGTMVPYLYYIEILLKCLTEIEQQVTTGNEVVSTP